MLISGFLLNQNLSQILGQYQCFAENTWGTATSNSVFVRKAELNAFRDEPPLTVNANEGEPFHLVCHPPDGWPKPNVYWLIQVSVCLQASDEMLGFVYGTNYDSFLE